VQTGIGNDGDAYGIEFMLFVASSAFKLPPVPVMTHTLRESLFDMQAILRQFPILRQDAESTSLASFAYRRHLANGEILDNKTSHRRPRSGFRSGIRHPIAWRGVETRRTGSLFRGSANGFAVAGGVPSQAEPLVEVSC